MVTNVLLVLLLVAEFGVLIWLTRQRKVSFGSLLTLLSGVWLGYGALWSVLDLAQHRSPQFTLLWTVLLAPLLLGAATVMLPRFSKSFSKES